MSHSNLMIPFTPTSHHRSQPLDTHSATISANDKAERWLAMFLRDRHLWLCAAVSLVFVFMPPDGIPSLDICLYKHWTQAPCPGCGITRSGSNLVRGDFAKMMNYNPFGLVLVPLIFALGILGLMHTSWRDEVRRRLMPMAQVLRIGYFTVIAGFVSFGLVRWFCVFNGWLDFPTTWF